MDTEDGTPVTVIETVREEDDPHEAITRKLPEEILENTPKKSATRPALPHERFAAFVVDSLFFFYLLGGWSLLLKHFLREDLTTFLSFKKPAWILFGTSGAALYFLYYLFFEGILTGTPGKLLGGLRIERGKGGTPSLFAILIRNLFRLIDTPLFFLTGIGLIESTQRHRRLGDLIAGTVVVRRIDTERVGVPPISFAGSTRRTIAFFLDLLWILPFGYGLLWMIPASRALVSLVALNLLPLVIVFTLTLSETLFQTTLGKILLGIKIVQEDGRPAKFSPLVVRNLFRLFDMNPIGYFCAFLSTRKQRPGDVAAGTIAVRHPRNARALLAIPSLILLAVSAFYVGWKNPDSGPRKNLKLQLLFGDRSFHPLPVSVERLLIRRFRIESLKLGGNEKEGAPRESFGPGEMVYLLFQISDYEITEGKAWVQADLRVKNPEGGLILDQPNIINASLPVGNKKTAKLVTRFVLHPQAPAGRYEVQLRLKDLFAKTETEESVFLVIRR